MPIYKKSLVFNIPITQVTLKNITRLITSFIANKNKQTFFYVNAHCINIAMKDAEYLHILQKADLVYSGGYGPILASKILRSLLLERTPTPDFIDKIFAEGEINNWSFYFIGSRMESLEKTVCKLKIKFPNLNLKGYHQGYFSKQEEEALIRDINIKKPTFLIVGMGTPKQEKWINDNMKRIDAKIFWAVGAMFDVISGTLPRAPKWVQVIGLEWLYRFFQEPYRLWRRYTLGNMQFLYLILKTWFKIHSPFVFFWLVLIVEILLIFYISSIIYQKYQQNILGTKLAVYPIQKSEYALSTSSKLKYYYEPKPNSTRTDSPSWLTYQTHYQFNNEGFNNSRDFEITKPQKTFRIMTLGDSHTFGLYVDPPKNYPTQLENLLNSQKCKEIENFEVINLGVLGFDIPYSIERFARRGQKYLPDLIIWLIKQDDIFQINELLHEKFDKIKAEMTANGEQARYEKMGSFYQYRNIAQDQLIKEFGSDKIFTIQKQNIDYFSSLYSGKLIILSYPYKLSEYRSLLQSIRNERPLTYFLDSFPGLNYNTQVLPDNHPNEAGYAFIASQLFEYIKSNNIIPCNSY